MRNLFARWKSSDTAPAAAQDAPAAEPGVPDEAGQIREAAMSVRKAADGLISGGATRALFISPEGDEGAAASVMVGREIADAGLRVLLIDLTVSGAASRVMLDNASRTGITDLLASEASFTDAVHVDLYSDCHVVPVGTVEPARAMRSADRLPVIMRSLTNAYDLVLVECGATDADGIRSLVADGTELMVSAIQPDDQTDMTLSGLKADGYGHVTLVSPAGPDEPEAPSPERAAA